MKFHRRIIEWEWYDDGNTFRMFFHLVVTANHDTVTSKGRTIRRGQRLTSVRHLARELDIDEKTVQRCLRNLESTKEIKLEPSVHGTMITIRKYNEYQGDEIQGVGTIPTEPPTPPPTPSPTEPPTPPPTEQECKECKNNINILPDGSTSGCTAPPTQEPVNFDELVKFFNETTRGVFGIVRIPLGEKRKALVRARIREHGKHAFATVVRAAAESDFLKGQNATGFTATFDWLVKPTNFEKVLSGNYRNKPSSGATPPGRDIIGEDFTSD